MRLLFFERTGKANILPRGPPRDVQLMRELKRRNAVMLNRRHILAGASANAASASKRHLTANPVSHLRWQLFRIPQLRTIRLKCRRIADFARPANSRTTSKASGAGSRHFASAIVLTEGSRLQHLFDHFLRRLELGIEFEDVCGKNHLPHFLQRSAKVGAGLAHPVTRCASIRPIRSERWIIIASV